MASVLNRTTRQYLASVNTPDYPEADWIINPDLSAVAGFPAKYWVVTGDVVSLMSQAERDVVDAAEQMVARDGTAGEFDDVEGIERAFALVVLDEINMHADRVNAIKAAIVNGASLAAVRTAVGAVPDMPQRTLAQLKTALRSKLGS